MQNLAEVYFSSDLVEKKNSRPEKSPAYNCKCLYKLLIYKNSSPCMCKFYHKQIVLYTIWLHNGKPPCS